jgi:hypothetical protein
MKFLQLLFVLLMPLLTFSRTRPTLFCQNFDMDSSKPKQEVSIDKTANLNSIDSNVIDIVKYVLTVRNIISNSEGTAKISKDETSHTNDNIYGYLTLKKNTQIKLYESDSATPLPVTDSISIKTQEEVFRKHDPTRTVIEIPNSELSQAEGSFEKIDSIQIKLKLNRITRIVLFFDDDNIAVDTSEMTLADVNNQEIIGFNIGGKREYVKLSDILKYIPINDEDNVVSGVYTLSSTPLSASRIALLIQ